MKAALISLFTLLTFVSPLKASADMLNLQVRGPRAVTLDVHGKNGGFDQGAYEETRRQISEGVADGSIDHFTVYRYYQMEGGFAACVELGRTPVGLRELEARFENIHFDSSTTAFYVGTDSHCR